MESKDAFFAHGRDSQLLTNTSFINGNASSHGNCPNQLRLSAYGKNSLSRWRESPSLDKEQNWIKQENSCTIFNQSIAEQKIGEDAQDEGLAKAVAGARD